MKFYFFYFLFFIILGLMSVNIVSAGLNLAPGKLNFNMKTENMKCEEIVVVSEDYTGEVSVRDVWASVEEGNNINKFYMTAEDFGININYPETIDLNKKKTIEVCLSGNNIKEGKGAIIFTPKSETNVVVEVGTWLFVEGESFNPPLYDDVFKEDKKPIEKKQVENQAPITGAVVGKGKVNLSIIVIVLLVIVIIGMAIYFNRKIKRNKI